VPVLAVSPFDPNTVYAGNGDTIYASTDGGVTFTTFTLPLPNYDGINGVNPGGYTAPNGCDNFDCRLRERARRDLSELRCRAHLVRGGQRYFDGDRFHLARSFSPRHSLGLGGKWRLHLDRRRHNLDPGRAIPERR
jgi:hypothetical protein